jgi:hypothetical protein
MSFSLDSVTTGTRLRPPRIILLGVEKIGKSTFASQADGAIFIPVKGEEGIDSIKVAQFPTCQSFQDVLSCVGSLYQEKHEHKTCVVDSASALEPLLWRECCKNNVDKNGNFCPVDSIEKVGGGYAKGYTEALNLWRQLTEGLDALRNEKNMAIIIIGHVKIKRFDSPEGDSYDQYQFDLHEKASNLMYRWADAILFAKNKVVVKKEDIGFGKEKKRGIDNTGGQRFIYTQKTPAYPCGGRGVYGQLPNELPLSWQAYMSAILEANNETT